MSSLKIVERQCFEELLGMASGYVLDFTNPTFSEFFRESAHVDIYTEKYAFNGDSKAKRLRAFIEVEPDPLVGKVLSDLLEYWRYKTTQVSPRDEQLASQAARVTERMLGKPARPKESIDEFLKHDFGPLALQRIPSVGPLASVLEARLDEASRCLHANAPLAVIFHCGSVLEGLLLGVASAHPQTFNQAPSSPKDKNGKVLPFHNWTLSQFIDVACEVGSLKLDVKKFSHGLRDFRNYIHPYQQLSSGFSPDQHTAEICLQVLRAAIASLSGSRA